MAGYRTRPAVREKGHADLITEFDLASERLLRERLGRATPEIPVVGEEEGGAAGTGLAWYCDPIDGTTNYAHGHPFWAVSVGLMDGGQPLLGAVVAPVLGLAWWGKTSGGAWRNSEPCRVSETRELREALIATGFPHQPPPGVESNFDSFIAVKRASRGVRRCGSAAIDLCLVADGTYDGYWERRLNAWDIAAGAAIVLAAGGRLSHLDGGPPRLTEGNLVAGGEHVHLALLQVLDRLAE
jgi:myo-inositol-1(or 4)-monophosphatase